MESLRRAVVELSCRHCFCMKHWYRSWVKKNPNQTPPPQILLLRLKSFGFVPNLNRSGTLMFPLTILKVFVSKHFQLIHL